MDKTLSKEQIQNEPIESYKQLNLEKQTSTSLENWNPNDIEFWLYHPTHICIPQHQELVKGWQHIKNLKEEESITKKKKKKLSFSGNSTSWIYVDSPKTQKLIISHRVFQAQNMKVKQ